MQAALAASTCGSRASRERRRRVGEARPSALASTRLVYPAPGPTQPSRCAVHTFTVFGGVGVISCSAPFRGCAMAAEGLAREGAGASVPIVQPAVLGWGGAETLPPAVRIFRNCFAAEAGGPEGREGWRAPAVGRGSVAVARVTCEELPGCLAHCVCLNLQSCTPVLVGSEKLKAWGSAIFTRMGGCGVCWEGSVCCGAMSRWKRCDEGRQPLTRYVRVRRCAACCGLGGWWLPAAAAAAQPSLPGPSCVLLSATTRTLKRVSAYMSHRPMYLPLCQPRCACRQPCPTPSQLAAPSVLLARQHPQVRPLLQAQAATCCSGAATAGLAASLTRPP